MAESRETPFLDPDPYANPGTKGSSLASLAKGRSETTDSWGDYVPPDRKSQGGADQGNSNSNPFTRFRSDLEDTARRISQRRLDALQVRVAGLWNCRVHQLFRQRRVTFSYAHFRTVYFKHGFTRISPPCRRTLPYAWPRLLGMTQA